MAGKKTLPDLPLTPEQQRLVVETRWLAHWGVRRWLPRGIQRADVADARTTAMLGLIRAAQTFDSGRGTRFSGYASWWVRTFLQRWQYRRLRHRHVQGAALADMIKRDDGGGLEPYTTDLPVEETLATVELTEECRRWVSPRYWRVLTLYYIDGLSLTEVGAAMGFTQARAQQIVQKALAIVRDKCRNTVGKALEEAT